MRTLRWTGGRWERIALGMTALLQVPMGKRRLKPCRSGGGRSSIPRPLWWMRWLRSREEEWTFSVERSGVNDGPNGLAGTAVVLHLVNTFWESVVAVIVDNSRRGGGYFLAM